MTKKQIRSEILDIRKSLTADEVYNLSKNICNKIIKTDILKNISDICLYMPIQNEVDVRNLITVCRNKQIRIWLPRIMDHSMDFYQYNENTPLIEGAYNILEPDNNHKLIPNDHTLIINPGSVFSTKGDRIGYGGGYYDRYMSTYPFCKYLAVCYNFQILDNIPCEEHDQRPDIIVSEKQIIYISK